MPDWTTRKKNALWNADCHCHWCGKETKLYKNTPKGFVTPNDAATLDHLYTKKDPRRWEYKRKRIPSPVVLSCYECNHERGSELLEKTETRFSIKNEYVNKKKEIEKEIGNTFYSDRYGECTLIGHTKHNRSLVMVLKSSTNTTLHFSISRFMRDFYNRKINDEIQ